MLLMVVEAAWLLRQKLRQPPAADVKTSVNGGPLFEKVLSEYYPRA